MNDKDYLDRFNSIISKLAFDTNTLWFLDIIYKLDVKFVDSGVETAGVTVQNFKPYLYINKKFVDNLNDDEYKGLILHEMLHLALYHTVRVHDDFNHEQWNIACDLEVNSLIESYKIKLPKGALFPKQFSMQNKLSSEMYYRDLNKNKKQNQQQNQQQQQGQGGGQGQQGQGGGQGQQGKNQQSKGGGKGNGKGNPQTLDDHSGWAQDETSAQMQKQILDKIVRDAVSKNQSDLSGSDTMDHIKQGHSQANDCSENDSQEQLTSGKQHGHGKGSADYAIESSEGGKVKWNHILNRLIRRTLSRNYIPSFKRTSRRYGEQVKGHIKNHVVDNLIIAVDTSGSINRKLHERFMEEIKLIKRMFKIKIRYIQCDDEIQQDMKFERYTDVNKIRIKGGGGTDFRPVFKLIEDKHYNPNAILYFTDGQGDYPEMSKYNTLWVLSDKECLGTSYKPPFGNILVLEDSDNA